MFKFLPIFATFGIAAVLALPFDILNPIPNPLKSLPFDPLNQVQNALKLLQPNDNSQTNSQENNSNNSSDKNHSNNDNNGSQDLFHVVDEGSKIVDLHKFVGSIKPIHLQGQLKKIVNTPAHLVEGALEIPDSIKIDVEDIVTNALDELENKINNTLKCVNEVTSEIVNYVRNVTEETVQQFINETGQAEATVSELREVAHDLLDIIKKSIENTIYGIEKKIYSILTNIKYTIKQSLVNGFYIAGDLGNMIKDFVGNVEQQINDATSFAYYIFHGIHRAIKFGIDTTKNIEDVFNFAHNIKDDIQDTIADTIIDDIEDKVSHVFK